VTLQRQSAVFFPLLLLRMHKKRFIFLTQKKQPYPMSTAFLSSGQYRPAASAAAAENFHVHKSSARRSYEHTIVVNTLKQLFV
jgi:hypothetical protein